MRLCNRRPLYLTIRISHGLEAIEEHWDGSDAELSHSFNIGEICLTRLPDARRPHYANVPQREYGTIVEEMMT